jgi:ElaB/YqjD/DUF883 family membrane-anchored ribosome-binding protein
MNDNSIRYPLPAAERLDEAVRANPTNALLIAAGIGFGIALLLKISQRKTPAIRMQSILEDLEENLRAATRPTARRAASLAEAGGQLFESTRGEVETALGRAVRDGRRNLKRLFC